MEDGGSEYPTWHWLWDLYLAGMCAVAIGAVHLLDDRVPGPSPAGATVLLALLAGWLILAGRQVPRLGTLGWRPLVYVVGAVVLWAAAMVCAPAAVAAVPALFPVVFSTLPLRAAVGAAVLVTLLPLGVEFAMTGARSPYFPVAVAMTLIGLVAGPIIGIMIVTSVRQRIALAGLVAELRDSRAETARLSRQAGVAAERERLAREIHDTLAQGFTSIVTLCQAIEAELGTDRDAAVRHLTLIESTARDNLAESRTMVAELTPTALEGATLPAAILRLCQAFENETGTAVDRRIAGDTPSAGMAGDVVLLRAAQEALSNIRRHSGAGAATVTLERRLDSVRLTVSDNGIGLGPGHADGFGLRGMRSRVAQVGGTVSVDSPDGVRLQIEVPV
ncbi:sensor histidine kinase [Mycobacterium sp. C31M]